MTLTISQVSRSLSVSTRTLRFYEEQGLIHSVRREEYAYRVYEEDTIRRLNQILFLRTLRLPLKQIAILLDNTDARQAVEILRTRSGELRAEEAELRRVRALVDRLLQKAAAGESWLEVPAVPEAPSAKEGFHMEHTIPLSDVRFLTLPPMTVASARYFGAEPENHAAELLNGFIRTGGLLRLKPDARVYGFNSPDPDGGSAEYGYEYWVTIPDDFPVPAPLTKKHMPGGLYAAHTIQLGDFHEWQWLMAWIDRHPLYLYDDARDDGRNMHGLLEEHLNHLYYCENGFPASDAERQLDLLFPIKKRQEEQVHG